MFLSQFIKQRKTKEHVHVVQHITRICGCIKKNITKLLAKSRYLPYMHKANANQHGKTLHLEYINSENINYHTAKTKLIQRYLMTAM